MYIVVGSWKESDEKKDITYKTTPLWLTKDMISTKYKLAQFLGRFPFKEHFKYIIFSVQRLRELLGNKIQIIRLWYLLMQRDELHIDAGMGIRSFCSNQISNCERVAQIAQDKWATGSKSLRSLRGNEWPWANRSGHSEEMSDRARIAQVAQDKWRPWAIRSGRSEEMIQWAICSKYFGYKI